MAIKSICNNTKIFAGDPEHHRLPKQEKNHNSCSLWAPQRVSFQIYSTPVYQSLSVSTASLMTLSQTDLRKCVIGAVWSASSLFTLYTQAIPCISFLKKVWTTQEGRARQGLTPTRNNVWTHLLSIGDTEKSTPSTAAAFPPCCCLTSDTEVTAAVQTVTFLRLCNSS